jgi:hypothetical protein
MSKHDNYRVKQTVKKVEAGSYEVYAGDVLIGHVNLTGQYGYDNYPWQWSLEDPDDLLGLQFQGWAETKRDCLDSMWHRAGLA